MIWTKTFEDDYFVRSIDLFLGLAVWYRTQMPQPAATRLPTHSPTHPTHPVITQSRKILVPTRKICPIRLFLVKKYYRGREQEQHELFPFSVVLFPVLPFLVNPYYTKITRIKILFFVLFL